MKWTSLFFCGFFFILATLSHNDLAWRARLELWNVMDAMAVCTTFILFGHFMILHRLDQLRKGSNDN